jgi:hypothetical protein
MKHLEKICPFKTSAASPYGDSNMCRKETVEQELSANSKVISKLSSDTLRILTILFPSFVIL